MDSPTPQKTNVRNIISIFENQSVNNLNNESNYLIRKTKSMGNLSHTPRVRAQIEPERNLELVQIEQQIEHLQNKLNYNYHTYVRETHVYYQNQIVFLLGDLCNVESGNNPKLVDLKSELSESLKRINKKLNSLLPTTTNSTPEVRSYNSTTHSTTTHKKGPVVKSKSFEENLEKIRLQRSKSEQIEVEDSVAVSVKTLKQLFERNTNGIEGRSVVKRANTYSGEHDFKYVPYSEKLKKENSLDIEEEEVLKEEENGVKSGEMSTDSLSGSEMSDEDSDED
ncbi:uncharacterized protein LOC123003623 [Tribolium madens]|uniref:uncharacterized protein LOC123003623 n=1 Tax=Tribolium madens TaxID=41895 RepID=UPI001CF73E46|nr:uncharacterized protein LOC123003623 [Tribolium madens]XP_044252443.1 uncharacterized protein LOC123003623 [Tribolium madens]XP_044252444.1 uncharacterized protein LOC123003623 [Tribolium madens]